MSTPLPVRCVKSGCDAEIGGYDHVCANQHLQYRVGKVPSIVLMAASILSIYLFQTSGDLWPMYILASMGLIHAFAIAFSRGKALGHTAGYVTAVAILWLVWEILESQRIRASGNLDGLVTFKDWTQSNPIPVVLGVLIASTIWMFHVGDSTALDGLHLIARMYLSVGTFILGSWGSWGLLIQLGEVPTWLMEGSLVATLVSPLVILLVQSGMVVRLNSRLLAITFWATLLSVYLWVTRPLINMVTFFLRDLLPSLVGHPSLEGFENLRVLTYVERMTQVSMVLQVVGLFSLAAASLALAIERFEVRVPTWYSAWKRSRTEQSPSALTTAIMAPVEWSMVLANLATNLALMVIEFVKSVFINIYLMLRQTPLFARQIFQFLLVPVATFAAISLVFIIALQDLRLYVLQFHDDVGITPTLISGTDTLFHVIRDARTLWGESVTVVLLALVISALTFVIADHKFRSEGLAPICVVFLGYLTLTGIGSALSFAVASMRSRISLPFELESYGDLLMTNLVLVVGLIVLVIGSSIPAAIGSVRNSGAATGAFNLSMVLVTLPLLAFTGYAVLLGVGPVLSAVRVLLGR